MSVVNPISSEVHKNIFNVFNKGRSYFKLRSLAEILLTISAVVGICLLVKSTLTVYPTIVRDYNNKAYYAQATPYTTSYAEISTLAIDSMRLLFTTQGDKNYINELRPFVARNILASVQRMLGSGRADLVRSTTVQDFFITQTGSSVQAVIYLTMVQTNKSNSVVQPIYFNLLLRNIGRSSSNPTGWMIAGLLRMDEASYLEKRNQFLGATGFTKPSTQLTPVDSLKN